MSVDFEAIRKQEWPVLEQMVFLDAACVSFAPQRTVRAVKAFADMTATQEEEKDVYKRQGSGWCRSAPPLCGGTPPA